MIQLTRLGGEPFILNAELIQYVEGRPDTFITLTTGQRLVVEETMDEVLRRTVVYQQAKHLVPAAHTANVNYRGEPPDRAKRSIAKETL
jgi:flagellar protein FlbD